MAIAIAIALYHLTPSRLLIRVATAACLRRALPCRPPYDLHPPHPTSAVDDVVRCVTFRHPAYPDFLDQNIFLSLPAWDKPGGLHISTARLACAIVACNVRHGYFVSYNYRRVALDDDQLLTEPSYWFYVPLDDGLPGAVEPRPDNALYSYPLCPSFAQRIFPLLAWREAAWPPGWADAVRSAVAVHSAPSVSSCPPWYGSAMASACS